ncbi:exodeoxyribonuclease VII large subunit [Thiohalomonas denitrificans]|uniref:Exodeoxyribonuclease 7 large subunit n=1 Tax=Thiohalomonas denitrificans TaxID=415747 RepID=A0A1G5Q1L7_9GAMM|nr:exodeoxyribonuclease VII large subunit [Thiohalomonas denitrificans]SCZ55542.1 Exodeoxyribonuclease VII large subunit [Thiohalomonas denitrificans]
MAYQPQSQFPPDREVFTVSRLNREVRSLLELSLPLIWLEGELSNLARPGSGHLYFSLKDENAQVRCAMFRTRNMHLRFRPENGTHVLVRARVGLYEARGEYQLIIEHMEEAGDGALRRQFEALKARLAQEGLFDASAKRPLPDLPRQIGIVTSPTGAAVRDILTVLRRRFPAIPVIIYPVPVQGAGAGREIARMLARAGERNECDVLIVTRGGGSLEDLWAFNDEVLARAIRNSPIPVVSAVGHEIDFTIADFAADLRAPTPSAAAEVVSPDRIEWLERVSTRKVRLRRCMDSRLQQSGQRLHWLEKRLKHPGRRLMEIAQRLDETEQRMRRAQRGHLRHLAARLDQTRAHLARVAPVHRLQRLEAHRCELERRLHVATEHRRERAAQRLAAAARALNSVSPLSTLSRGYAIVSREDHTVVHRTTDVRTGDRIIARLHEGRLVCRVEETYDD